MDIEINNIEPSNTIIRKTIDGAYDNPAMTIKD